MSRSHSPSPIDWERRTLNDPEPIRFGTTLETYEGFPIQDCQVTGPKRSPTPILVEVDEEGEEHRFYTGPWDEPSPLTTREPTPQPITAYKSWVSDFLPGFQPAIELLGNEDFNRYAFKPERQTTGLTRQAYRKIVRAVLNRTLAEAKTEAARLAYEREKRKLQRRRTELEKLKLWYWERK